MRDGFCPNCGSNQILISEKPKLLNGRDGFAGWFIKLRKNNIILRHYACKDCYLLETYIDDYESMINAMTEWNVLNTDSTDSNEKE